MSSQKSMHKAEQQPNNEINLLLSSTKYGKSALPKEQNQKIINTFSNIQNSDAQLNYYFQASEENQEYIKNYVKSLNKRSNLYKKFSNMSIINSGARAISPQKPIYREVQPFRFSTYENNNESNLFPLDISHKKSALPKAKNQPYSETETNYMSFQRGMRKAARQNELYEYPKENGGRFQKNISVDTFPLIEIQPDGNCTYRAIGTLITGEQNSKDSTQYIPVRQISSEYINDDYIKQNALLAIIYHIFSERNNIIPPDGNKNLNTTQKEKVRLIRAECTAKPEEVYIVESRKIFNVLNSSTKKILREFIQPMESYFNTVDYHHSIWGMISEDEKEKIRTKIRDIVKNSAKYKTYLDINLELPTLLEGLYQKGYGNIVLVEFSYDNEKHNFNSYRIYTKQPREDINERTLFGFITNYSGIHTDLIYPRLFTISELPPEMKEPFDSIFKKK